MNALKDLNLSRQEADRLSQAIKDPSISQLLADYAESLADPQTKQEAEQYLRQIEAQGAAEELLGKGVIVAAPEPSFVFKTLPIAGGCKVFINICTSDKDKQGADCRVCDAVVHPAAVMAASTEQRVKVYEEHLKQLDLGGTRRQHQDKTNAEGGSRDLLVDAVIDRIEEHDSCRLSRKYSCPKLRYKGTPGVLKPPLITVKGGDSSTHVGQPGGKATACKADPPKFLPSRAATTSKSGGAKALIEELSSTSTTSSIDGGGNKSSSTATTYGSDKLASRSTFQFPQAQAGPAQHPSTFETGSKAQQQATVAPAAEVEPHYTVSHRGRVDLAAQAWGDAGRGLHLESGRPKELVVRIDLPGVESLATVDVLLSNSQLDMVVTGSYRLQLRLPYPVNDQAASARYLKARQKLEVVLPVEQPPLHASGSDTSTAGSAQQEAGSEGAEGNCSGRAVGNASEGEQVQSSEVMPAMAADGMGSTSIRDGVDSSSTEQCSAAPGLTGGSAVTESRQRWLDIHAGLDEQAVALGGDRLEAGQQAGWRGEGCCGLLEQSAADHFQGLYLLNSQAAVKADQWEQQGGCSSQGVSLLRAPVEAENDMPCAAAAGWPDSSQDATGMATGTRLRPGADLPFLGCGYPVLISSLITELD
ncbi:hypothetical protein N2152v2_009441 [Parachlorella kessleri]